MCWAQQAGAIGFQYQVLESEAFLQLLAGCFRACLGWANVGGWFLRHRVILLCCAGVAQFVRSAFEDSISGILNKRQVDVLHDIKRKRAKGEHQAGRHTAVTNGTRRKRCRAHVNVTSIFDVLWHVLRTTSGHAQAIGETAKTPLKKPRRSCVLSPCLQASPM